MPDEQSVRNGAITSDEQIRDVLRRHIRKALDRRAFTRETLAQDSKVNIHAIDAILSRDPAKHRRIAIVDAFCLAYELGDEAVNALVGTISYTACRPDAEVMAPMMIAATAMQGLSVIATAAADGRFDHNEAPIVQEAADLIIATVKPLSSSAPDTNERA